MKHLGTVSCEGGPLLISDAIYVRAWRGIDDDGSDYERACQAIDAEATATAMIPVDGKNCLLWDFGGPGTADAIELKTDSICFVRSWPTDPLKPFLATDYGLSKDLAAFEPAGPAIEVPSSWIAVLWATESGAAIKDKDLWSSEAHRPSGPLSVSGSALVIPVPAGPYSCYSDEIDVPAGHATRLFVWKNNEQA